MTHAAPPRRRRTRRLLRRLPWLLALGLVSGAAAAEQQWGQCGAGQPAAALPDLGPESDQTLRLSADHAETTGKDITRFSGSVVMQRAGKRIEAQQALYDKGKDTLDLSGNVDFVTRNLTASSDRAHLDMDKDSGELYGARYRFRSAHASGSADTIVIADPRHVALQGATYTTCNPDDVSWQLKARQINLDQTTNTGEARHVTLEFKGVPLLYLPYINFPLAGRKSGLLAPVYGQSTQTGTEIGIPYYWNIAPNYDATFTVRNMTARGTMLQSEFRYLQPANRGQLGLDYLPDDKRDGGKSRLHVDYNDQAALGDGWTSGVVYKYVSDVNYFNDLANSQLNTSTTSLERRFDLAYQGGGINFLGRFQGFQTLSGTATYERLPQLTLDASTQPHPDTLRLGLHSELVNFASSDLVPTGTRVDLKPTLSMPLEGPAWFFTPSVAMRYTAYQLKDNPTGNDPTRTLPIASLDSGLYFDRDLTIGDHALVQTLEPRLYYLYVPYRDQSNLPLFDTAAYDFTFGQLFRDNRFSGTDRQGDANQVTMALTSRVRDANDGRELLRTSIGQIHYFSDRLVTVPGQTTAETQRSDLVAEIGSQPLKGLDLAADARWNADTSQTEVGTFGVHYSPEKDKVLSLDYRYRRDLGLHQADLAAFWPVTPRWRLLGRFDYDFEGRRTLDSIGGIAYEACCWALHLTVRQHLNTVTLQTDHSVYLSLELKGLGSLGGPRLEDVLDRDILKRQ